MYSRQMLSLGYYFFLLLTSYKNICFRHLKFLNTYSYVFQNYGVINLENIRPTTFRSYRKPHIKMLLRNQDVILNTCKRATFL